MTISVTAGGSTQETIALAYNADDSAIDYSLESLSNVDDVVVTGGPLTSDPFIIEQRGVNAEDNLALMEVDATGVTGTKYVTVAEVTPGEDDGGISSILTNYWRCDEATGTRNDSVGSNNLLEDIPTGSTAGKIGLAVLSSGSFIACRSDTLAATDIAFSVFGWVYLFHASIGNPCCLKDRILSAIFRSNNATAPPSADERFLFA